MEVITILEHYGPLVSLSGTTVLVFVGWLVVFNGSKYLASRSESRAIFLSFLERLSELVEKRVKLASSSTDLVNSSQLIAESQLATISLERLENYKVVLKHYGLDNFISDDDLINLKFLITYIPEKEIKGKELEVLGKRIIKELQSLSDKIERDAHSSYLSLHKPTQKPFLSKIGTVTKGVLLGCFVIVSYSLFVFAIFEVN